MPERSQDWLRQADSDLRHARHSRDAGDCDWAAFASHQAAERAIKALFQKLNLDALGHTLSVLLENLPNPNRPGTILVNRAKELTSTTFPRVIQVVSSVGRRRISIIHCGKPSARSTMPRSSLNSVVIKSVDEGNVRLCMDAYAERLLRDPQVEEVVVFGSFAHGDYAPGSDIDVFVLLRKSEKSVRDRIPDLLPGAFPIGVDVFPYTIDEIESLAPSAILDDVRSSTWRYRRPGDAARESPKP